MLRHDESSRLFEQRAIVAECGDEWQVEVLAFLAQDRDVNSLLLSCSQIAWRDNFVRFRTDDVGKLQVEGFGWG